MSWLSKVCLFTVPLFLTLSAWGQRIEFSRSGDKAVLESHLLSQRNQSGTSVSTVAPVEMKLSIPFVDLENTNDGYQSLHINGLVPLSKPGVPDVSVTGQLIAVPNGYTAELSIVDQKSRNLNGVVLHPNQRQLRCGGEMDGFSFNSALYDSNSIFPAQVAQLEEVGQLQSLKLMRVALNPIQVDFAHKATIVTTDLKVQVNFRKLEGRQVAPNVLPASFYKMARAVTANGKGLGNAVRANRSGEVMLIIVADTLKNEIGPLLQWKQQKGITTQVYTTTEAGGKKEEIKKFIKNYYDSSEVKPTYLLMIGNKDTAPTNMESTGSGSAATDWTYTLLSGDDNIPDVFYGRLVADNATDLQVQMSRWIAYEKSPEAGAEWYHNAMTIASNDGSGPSDKEYAQQIQEILKAHTYKATDSFFNGEKTATAENITNATNEGRSWIAYFGHGSGTSWASTNDTFSNTQVEELKNTRLPFIIDVACQNASWVKIPKCFGKAWVTHVQDGKNAGAVAFYGGSVNISWHPPAVMSVGVAKYHFEKSIATLGGSVLAGQLYLIEKMGTGSDTLDNMKWYNLLGDPSLSMRTSTPKAYNLKHQISRIADDVVLAVEANDDQGNGVSGLTVAVSLGNRGTLAVGKTDDKGKAPLKMSAIGALEPDTMLTATGYNAETQQIALGN